MKAAKPFFTAGAFFLVISIGVWWVGIPAFKTRAASSSDVRNALVQGGDSQAAAGFANPLAYPGGDLGDKINNVLAGGNCAEVKIPQGSFTYATTIRITSPCQSIYGAGSAATTLEYMGKGDAILWQMLPYTIKKAGTLKGFTLKGPGISVKNGIRTGTVIAATFEDLVINNFRGPNSAAILFENIKTAVEPQGRNTFEAWTERTVMRDVHIGVPHIGNTAAIVFVKSGGTDSFGYADISDVWLNVENGQVGIRWGEGTYTYNSRMNVHANISGSGSNAFLVEGTVRNSEVILTGEAKCAKDLVHVTRTGDVQAHGFVAVNCGSSLTTDKYARTDLAGVQVDNPRWDAFQLSPQYAPLVNGAGVLIVHNLGGSAETDFTNYYGPNANASAGGFNFYNTHASVNAPTADSKALLAKLTPGGWMATGSVSWGGGETISSSDHVALKTQLPLIGRTGPIGGSLKVGNCVSGTASITGAKVGQVVPHPNASDGSLDSPQEIVSGAVTTANTVTVRRCATVAVTLPAKTYNVRVIP